MNAASNDPIVDAAGRYVAPPQPVLESRPAGPWQGNGSTNDEIRAIERRMALGTDRQLTDRELDELNAAITAHMARRAA